jgi:hypothetical protein
MLIKQMEPTQALARGPLGGMPKRPKLIRALKGAVLGRGV